MRIPKNIMQTWKTTTLPKRWQISQDSIKKKMPDWNYTLMTDEDNRNFVIQYFPEYLNTYDKFQYTIQRVDMIRPMWLYIHGGVYMDLDYVVNKSFEELFDNDADLYFVPSANTSIYFTNSFMASIPRHPFWLEYLNHMKAEAPLWALTKHFYVMTTTGPIGLSKVLQNSRSVYSVLPQKRLIPCDVCNIGNCKGGYLKTIEGQSWNGWDSLALNFVYCNWKTILMVICIIIIIYTLWKYKKVEGKGSEVGRIGGVARIGRIEGSEVGRIGRIEEVWGSEIGEIGKINEGNNQGALFD